MAPKSNKSVIKICGACLDIGDESSVDFVNMGHDFWSFAEFCGKINYYFSDTVWLCNECSDRVKCFLQFRDCVRKATIVIYDILQDAKLGKAIDYEHLKRARGYLGIPQLLPEKRTPVEKPCKIYIRPVADVKRPLPIGLTRKYFLPSSGPLPVNSLSQGEAVNDNKVSLSLNDADDGRSNGPQTPETLHDSDNDEHAAEDMTNAVYQIIVGQVENQLPLNEHDYGAEMDTVRYYEDVEHETEMDDNGSADVKNINTDSIEQGEELWEILPEAALISGHMSSLREDGEVGEIVRLEGADALMQLIVEKEGIDPKVKAKQKPLNYKAPKEKREQPDVYVEFEMVYLTRSQIMADLEARRLDKRYAQAEFQCEPCARGFPDKQKYDTHMERHKPSFGGNHCDICGQYSKSRPCYHKHYHRHCVRYKCTRCDFMRPHNGLTVMQHYRKKHKCAEETHCKICDRVYLNADYPTHDCERSTVTCEYCDQRMSRKSYNGHVLLRHTARNFKCAHCCAAFPREKLLDFHTRTCHSQTNYCSDCNKYFKTKFTLEWHLDHSRQHMTPDKPIKLRKCEHCPLEMPHNSYRKHIDKCHPTYAEFHCPHCPEVYETRFELRRHVKRHDRERRLQETSAHCCDICGKSFRSREHFMRHKKIHLHNNERPFKCAVCDRTFITRETCFLHIQRVHEGRVRIRKRGTRFRKARPLAEAVPRVTVEEQEKIEESICYFPNEIQDETDQLEI